MNEPSAAAALVGTTIAGKYRLTRLLGEGGMGAVFLGEQKLGDASKQVAVKVLHKEIANDPKVRARFERECGIVAQLHHPNTIQVFDFGTAEDGSLFIVMEFVEGKSVGSILEKEGPMPPERVKKVLEQVTGSLEEAHARGIVHRDLKPDNIVLCDRPGQRDWVEVLDFGIAKRSSESDPNEQKLTQMGMVLGTPPYMSPEQFTGQPIDARSDIYALAVMTFEMLTGRLPFQGNTPYEWATQHMTAAPFPFEQTQTGMNVPMPMRAAVLRGLEKRPEHRFANVREFYEAFAAQGAPGTAPGYGAPAAPPTMQTPPPPSAFGGGPRPGGTQMGPAVTPMGSPAMAYGAPGPGYPTPQPMPGMGPAPMGPQAGYGAPPASRPQKGGSGGLVIGILAAVVLVGGGGGGYWWYSHQSPSTASTSSLTTATAPVETVTIPTNPLGTAPTTTTTTGTATALPTLAQTGGKPPTGTTVRPQVPPDAGHTTPTGTIPPPPPPATTTGTPPPPPPPPPPTISPETMRICAEAAQTCANARATGNGRVQVACDKKAAECRAHGGKI